MREVQHSQWRSRIQSPCVDCNTPGYNQFSVTFNRFKHNRRNQIMTKKKDLSWVIALYRVAENIWCSSSCEGFITAASLQFLLLLKLKLQSREGFQYSQCGEETKFRIFCLCLCMLEGYKCPTLRLSQQHNLFSLSPSLSLQPHRRSSSSYTHWRWGRDGAEIPHPILDIHKVSLSGITPSNSGTRKASFLLWWLITACTTIHYIYTRISNILKIF